MADFTNDTIAAIATAPGEGGIAVVRVSGPQAGGLAARLLRMQPEHLRPRGIHVGAVHDAGGSQLDEVLVLWMPAPRSYTREDVLELQCHGGHAAAQAVLDAVLASGARLAEPGEFTLRAFLNGRLDLVQAEAVADVIAARTTAALAVHEELLAGRLSQTIAHWQDRLGHALTLIEAHLDFADEEDVGPFPADTILADLAPLRSEMQERLETFTWGRTTRDGFKVALVGAPNTGKSSLLNALLQENRAIVSPHPGTTRDVIDAWMNAGGVAVQVTDTAGLRSTHDTVEREGVARARDAARRADLVVFVTDGSRPLHPEECDEISLLTKAHRPAMAVVNKSDLGGQPIERLTEMFGKPPLPVSALTGAGLTELMVTWRHHSGATASAHVGTPLTRRRQQQGVRMATEALSRALSTLEEDGYLEAAAAELHAARRHLAELLGWGSPEDVLDGIFRDFCIGK